jgi:hypothetical protein
MLIRNVPALKGSQTVKGRSKKVMHNGI